MSRVLIEFNLINKREQNNSSIRARFRFFREKFLVVSPALPIWLVLPPMKALIFEFFILRSLVTFTCAICL